MTARHTCVLDSKLSRTFWKTLKEMTPVVNTSLQEVFCSRQHLRRKHHGRGQRTSLLLEVAALSYAFVLDRSEATTHSGVKNATTYKSLKHKYGEEGKGSYMLHPPHLVHRRLPASLSRVDRANEVITLNEGGIAAESRVALVGPDRPRVLRRQKVPQNFKCPVLDSERHNLVNTCS